MRKTEAVVRREFFSKLVAKDRGYETECWEYQGYLNPPKFYGRTCVRLDGWDKQRPVYVHRLAFYFEHGRWPDNALHKCDNPPCCRPDHLWDGTKAENNRDMVAKGRHWSQKRKY